MAEGDIASHYQVLEELGSKENYHHHTKTSN